MNLKINSDNIKDLKKISFDDLPRYSKQIFDFIFSDTKYSKNHTEINREFQIEKWGMLLEYFEKKGNFCLDDVQNYNENLHEKGPCCINGQLYLTTKLHLEKMHLDLYQKVLSKHIDGASCLVELGAGFGAKIFKLSQKKEFENLPLKAGEYTNAGIKLMKLLAKNTDIDIEVGFCDFKEMILKNFKIPKNAVIFTSYAAHYVPKLSNQFSKFFESFNPKSVIFFEPCYEAHQKDTIYGRLCRNYIEKNDYTRNLIEVLTIGEKNNFFKLNINKNIIGSNPLLPISILEYIRR